MDILTKEFYQRDTLIVARELIGKKLVRIIDGNKLIGIISETEAYRSDDPASHCFIGKTDRNRSMFGPVGHAYVYISYGIHYCFNIVSRDIYKYPAGGVLIRAVIPELGLDLIKLNRNIENKKIKNEDLCNGPAKFTQAFAITKEYDSIDLTNEKSNLYVLNNDYVQDQFILNTKRIGISVAKEKLWRYKLINYK